MHSVDRDRSPAGNTRCSFAAFFRVSNETIPSLQVELVRFQVAGRLLAHALLFVGAQSRFQCSRNAQRDIGLNREDVREITIVRLRPEMLVALRIDQLRDDAHAIAGAAHAPLEDRRSIQLRTDLAQAVLAFLERHDRGPRNHLETADLRQVGNDIFGDAVGEVLVLRIRAQVEERQYRDGSGARSEAGG